MSEPTASLVRLNLLSQMCDSLANMSSGERTSLINEQALHNLTFGQSPFSVLDIAVESLRRHVTQSDYNAVEGIPELRQGICDFHQHFDHLTFEPDDVIVGSGSKELAILLMLIFNGDILMSSSTGTSYMDQAILTGHRPVVIEPLAEDDYRITPKSLEKVITENSLSYNKLLILVNPCHTTGSFYSQEHLKELTNVFRQYNIIVLSDEINARLSFRDNHTSLVQYYPEGTILSTGPSKWANAGGWRIGYNVYPKELSHLLSAVKTAASHSYSCAPAPMQHAFAEVLKNLPACKDYIQHTTRVMKVVGMFCVRQLRSVGVSMADPTAGYIILLNFDVIRAALKKKGVVTCQEMCDLMLSELSVIVMPRKTGQSSLNRKFEVCFSYANFDGRLALAESRKRDLKVPLDEIFVKDFCSTLYDTTMGPTKPMCNVYTFLAKIKHITKSD